MDITDKLRRWGDRTTVQNHDDAIAAAREIEQLRTALQSVVTDINDYEEANKLHPNPGREECWDSVARAKRLLGE